MKVKQIKADDESVVLEATATSEEVNKVLHGAKVAFAQSMGMKPPAPGADIDAAAEEQMGIKDLDSIVGPSAIDALVPLAIDKKNLDPAYPPKAKAKSPIKRDADFTFEIEVALKPSYELTSYDPVEITVPAYAFDERAVDAQLAEMAKRYTAYVLDEEAPADRVVEKGDHIKIALKATENGEELKGLSTPGRTYTAGEGYMPEGFEKEILGMRAGQTKEFSFEGPSFDDNLDEYTQTVDVVATVLGFEKEATPTIDDEWVKMNMPMFKGVEELKKNMGAELEKQNRMQYDAFIRQEAAAELAKRFEGKIADEVYEAMREQYVTNLRADLQQQGTTLEQFMEQNGGEQQFGMLLMLQVRQMLVQGYALDALFRHEHMSLSDEDIENACKAMNPQANPQHTRKQLEASGRGFALRESAERLKANQFLVDNAKIIYANA